VALNRREVLKIGGLAALAGHLRPGIGAAEPDKRAAPAGAAERRGGDEGVIGQRHAAWL
jgi:hypothetical protein